MRRFLSKAVLPAMLLLAPLAGFAADTYSVDAAHSFFHFKVTHFGAGYTWGRFNDSSGTFSIDLADPTKSKVEITLKTASVDTANAKRDEHLKSPDFFDANTYPTLTFVGKSFKKVSDTRVEVTGDLTLHGKTKSVTMTLDKVGEGPDAWGGYRQGWDGSITIKRSDFGMTFMADGIGDSVTLFISVEGTRK